MAYTELYTVTGLVKLHVYSPESLVAAMDIVTVLVTTTSLVMVITSPTFNITVPLWYQVTDEGAGNPSDVQKMVVVPPMVT